MFGHQYNLIIVVLRPCFLVRTRPCFCFDTYVKSGDKAVRSVASRFVRIVPLNSR